jgi:hypothetical protein
VGLEAGPSEWAVQRFGDRYAQSLWALVPTAMAAAVSRQIDTHQASGLRSLHAYGGAWPAQYEELVNHVGGLDGVEVVRPAGSAVHLVVVNGHLLVPFRYADELTTPMTDPRVTQRLNKTCRALLGQFGPDPDVNQLTLTDELFPAGDDVMAEPKLLGDLEPDGMVLVFFAANVDAGLLEVGWGEAALPSDGSLQWKHTELLPLPKTPPAAGGQPVPVDGPRRPTGPDRSAGVRRFDEAPLPDPILNPRTPAEQSDVNASSSERPPHLPLADDDRH